MFRLDTVALHRLVGIQIDRMKIKALFAGDQSKRLVEITAQLLRRPGASGIVSGGQDPAGSSARVGFESADVVALPAMEGNRNLRKLFQRRIRIDADSCVVLFCKLIVPFNVLLCHIPPFLFWFSEEI